LIHVSGFDRPFLAGSPGNTGKVAHPLIPGALAPVGIVEEDEALMARNQAEGSADRQGRLDLRTQAETGIVAIGPLPVFQPNPARQSGRTYGAGDAEVHPQPVLGPAHVAIQIVDASHIAAADGDAFRHRVRDHAAQFDFVEAVRIVAESAFGIEVQFHAIAQSDGDRTLQP
jgi:hypothetical protein